MAVEVIVHPGVDSAIIAWRAPFIDQCRGFALYRKVKRGPGSTASPNTTSSANAQGFAEEIVASWVGFADGPDVEPGTRKPWRRGRLSHYADDRSVRCAQGGERPGLHLEPHSRDRC
jgi:hypothetical protein